MAQPVRWGILGTGAIAQKFASDLALVRDARLVAVASRTMARASAFAAAFAIPTALEGCEALARCADIDIIYIATPNSDHAAAALTCIAAKKAVLIEKPMATSVAEARQIAEAADAQGVFCMEAMWMRFTPGVVRAKAMIEAGAIGEVRHLQANLFYPQPYATDSRFFSAALGGGALLDLGVYPISLAIHLLGRPSTIAGSMVTTASGVDAQATAALGWDNKTAALSCGFTAEGDNSANVIGSQGHLRLHRQFLCPPFLTKTRTHGPQADAPSEHVERRRRKSVV